MVSVLEFFLFFRLNQISARDEGNKLIRKLIPKIPVTEATWIRYRLLLCV